MRPGTLDSVVDHASTEKMFAVTNMTFVLIACITDNELVTVAIEMNGVSCLRSASQMRVSKTLALEIGKRPTERLV